MKVKGKCCNSNLKTTEIELSPRDLLEQITHKEIGELLDLINLPTCFTCKYPCPQENSICKMYKPKQPELPEELNWVGRGIPVENIKNAEYIMEIYKTINQLIKYLKKKEEGR